MSLLRNGVVRVFEGVLKIAPCVLGGTPKDQVNYPVISDR